MNRETSKWKVKRVENSEKTFPRRHAAFARVIARLDDAIRHGFADFLARPVLAGILRGKFRESHRRSAAEICRRDRQWRFNVLAYIATKNIRWDHCVHATFCRINKRALRYVRAKCESPLAADAQIRDATRGAARTPRLFRDRNLHSRLTIATVSRSRWRASEGSKMGMIQVRFYRSSLARRSRDSPALELQLCSHTLQLLLQLKEFTKRETASAFQ